MNTYVSNSIIFNFRVIMIFKTLVFIGSIIWIKNGETAYCPENLNPTWVPQPNLRLSMNGIDLPKKSPMAYKTIGDPSVKGQIFTPTTYNPVLKAFLPYNFYTYHKNVHCDTSFQSEEFGDLQSYEYSSIQNSVSGMQLGYTEPITSTIETITR